MTNLVTNYNPLSILVTRQMPQAKLLVSKINALGWAKAMLCPLLEITPSLNKEHLKSSLSENYDLAIFTSVHAVTTVMPLLVEIDNSFAWAAIGNSTASALKQYGLNDIITPTSPFNSESLLKTLANFKFKHHSAIIFKGENGRDLLEKELTVLKVKVNCVTCYKRDIPNTGHRDLTDIIKKQPINIILATCETILYNLASIDNSDIKSKLQASTLLVASPRIRDTAVALGWTKIHLANGASDDDMLAAIIDLQ